MVLCMITIKISLLKEKMSIRVNNIFVNKIFSNSTIGGCIDVFENAWHNPQETINLLEKECAEPESGISWHRAETVGQGINQSIRTNYNLGISYAAQESNNLLAQNIHNQMYIMLLSTTIPYATKHGIEELYHENYNILRYRAGQEYKSHYDRTPGSNRIISAICYLNEDYEGGEIEFPNFGIKIKPSAGTLILFPSDYAYTHIAHPITKGTKYALVTWIHDKSL